MSKRYNNITNPFRNYYLDGGFTWDKNQTFGQNLKNNFQSGALAGATSVTGQLMGQGLSGGLSTGVGNTMQGLGSMASAIPGPWGAVTSAGLNVVGGLVNRLFGSQINQQAVNEFRNQNSQLQNTVLNADNTQDLLSQYGDVNLLSAIDKNSVGKDGLFSNKAKNLTASLNRDRNYARNTYFRGVNNTINNMQQDELFGTTRLAEGGNLFTNGITTINNGGTHEQNPLGGVPMGVDEQGVPNVVEQGELIANDYVYSNRLKVPNKDKVILGLKDKDITYAKALEKLSKESKERPNDPISQRGLQDVLDKLRMSQEELKYKKALKRNNLSTSNVFAEGGGKPRGKRFVIATNNYRFPLEEQYIKKGYPYSMNTMYDGTLLPSINTPKGNVSYGNWDSFKADSMAAAHGVQDAGSSKSLDLTKLRYAPVLGAAIGLSNSLFSKPDYSGVNRLTEASYSRGQYTPVSYNPIGDYMQYQPFDRNYYTNILNANTAATRRAINNQSVGNRATAMAGLLANDYNAQNKLGDLFRQADEYNIAQRQKVADFNRQTNMYNSEMGLKAAMANQSALMNLRNAQYQGLANALQMKDAIDARRGQSMSANLSNLFTSLGNIGIDAYNRNDRDMLINTDTYGTLSQKPQEWSETDWTDYKKRHNNTNSNKYGGKLKKRGGFTY